MMKKRYFLKCMSTLTLFSLLSLNSAVSAETILRLGSSKEGSATYSSAIGMSAVINKYLSKDGIRMEVVPGPGSTATIRMLNSDELDFAFTNTWVLRDAFNNTGAFKKSSVEIKPLQGWYFSTVCWVPMTKKGNKKITSLKDLAGKKFYPYNAGSGIYDSYRFVLSHLGIWDDIKVRQVGNMEAADALKMGTVDAIGVYASAGGYAAAGWVKNLDSMVELQAIKPSIEEQAQISKINGITSGPVPNVFLSPKNQKNVGELWGWALHYGMFPSPKLSEEIVYKVYKVWIEHADEMSSVHNMMKVYAEKDPLSWQINGIEEAGDLPVHPGVAKYLKEIGKWNDSSKIGVILK